MLYPTHKSYGVLWGLLMIPLSVLIGLIPVITVDMRNGDILFLMIACYMGMRGALFGARFPDIDSPGSIPARRHPYIRRVFAFFKIKHRGKFSHDFVTIGVLFYLLYKLVGIMGEKFMYVISNGDHMILTATYVGTVIFVYMAGLDIVSFFQWIANKLKNKKMWVILEKKRFLLAGINVVWLLSVLVVSGFVDVTDVATLNVSASTAMLTGTMLVVSFKMYMVFAWAGAYSHLFADMTTKSGVSILGIKLAPAQVVLKVKKIPLLGRLLVPTEFKTGSKWEDFNRLVINVLCIPALLLAIMVLTGFDIPGFVEIVKDKGIIASKG